LYDVGHQDGINFLVMEYVEGQTLAKRLVKGSLPLDQVLQYAIEIADALDKAHRKGVTHRDLKPGNIMLTKSGTKLPDSRFLGFFAGGKLKKIDVSGGPPITLGDASDPRSGTWNRDGVIIFGPTASSALQRVSAAGGVPTEATTLGQDDRPHAALLLARRPPFYLPHEHRPGRRANYVAALNSAERKLYTSTGNFHAKDKPNKTRMCLYVNRYPSPCLL
jgi:serine/threonine protein kinase